MAYLSRVTISPLTEEDDMTHTAVPAEAARRGESEGIATVFERI